MLLAIDVGNTNIVVGLYEGKKLLHVWRLATNKERTSDEFGVFFLTMFQSTGVLMEQVKDIIISSVAPNIMYSLRHAIRKFYNSKPMLVEPGIKTGLNIKIDNPRELGADLIVGAVAAYDMYKGPVIIVDFGTATKLSAVNRKGEFLGVVICPGIQVSADALTQKTAKLPRIQIVKPKHVLGTNTIESMQSGLVYGNVGKIDYLVNRIKDEIADGGDKRDSIKVVATGGLARLITEETNEIDDVNGLLTLEGLRLIYEKNKSE
ncbi:MAG: type III pantothenate kinase [Clostridiales bacterium]|nr:type III pantothenate kinase [Clostridiales bacterium]